VNDSLWTFLFEIANFAAFAALLSWLFFKPIRKALEDERAKSRRIEGEAAQKLSDAERLRTEMESKREALAGELDALRAKSREAASQEASQIVADARARADQERANVKRDSLNIERAQMARIAGAVAAATHATMGRFLQQMEGPELEQTLIKAVCRELAAFSTNSLAPVVIESAQPLDGAVRQSIDAALGAAAKSAEFRVVPDLEGGLRISTAHGLIDASLTGLANFAEQALLTEMESVLSEESPGE